MSRSKSYYQGLRLGRVQRSEYDDAKMRDLAREDARLGESLKTVERAKNVMKKSMEADKQLFIKTGSQSPIKPFMHSQGSHARPVTKAMPQHGKLAPDSRIKRFSVTDMPSDLDRSIHNSGRTPPRPISFHELMTESANLSPPGHGRELGPFDKLLDTNTSNLVSVKVSNLNHSDILSTPGALDRLSESDPSLTSEIDRRGIYPGNRATADSLRHGKTFARADSEKAAESRFRQRESSTEGSNELVGKEDQSVDGVGESKNRRQEQWPLPDQDQHTRYRKRSTIWETLSTPKHTSMLKSKRNQIEMEFTTSNLKSSKSSPALFSPAKVKASTQQGLNRPPLPRSGSVQGRQVEAVKEKQSTSSKS